MTLDTTAEFYKEFKERGGFIAGPYVVDESVKDLVAMLAHRLDMLTSWTPSKEYDGEYLFVANKYAWELETYEPN